MCESEYCEPFSNPRFSKISESSGSFSILDRHLTDVKRRVVPTDAVVVDDRVAHLFSCIEEYLQ